MLGYLIIGMIAGIASFVVALAQGASFWYALTLYSLSGTAVLTLLPLVQIAVSSLVARIEQSATSSATSIHSPFPAFSSNHSSERSNDNPVSALNILAVDDDPFMLALIPIILARTGFNEIKTVPSAKRALEELASTNITFDCLLLDINMPEMDGIELCRRVRKIESYKTTPIIMLSGLRDMVSMDNAFRAGASDYITKPFDVIELAERVSLIQNNTIRQMNVCDSGLSKIVTPFAKPQICDTCSSGDTSTKNLPNFIEPDALADYLSQLPSHQAMDTKVLAVKVDRIDEMHSKDHPAHFFDTLDSVTTALHASLDGENEYFCYAGGGTFLISSEKSLNRSSIDFESEINRILARDSNSKKSEKESPVTVSVGQPLRPRGANYQRAESSFSKAVAIANSRATKKQATHHLLAG